MKLINWIKSLLDPDRDWRSWSTIQHYIGGFVLCGLADIGLSNWGAFLLTVWTGAVFEAGQTDATYSIHDSSGRRYAGQPGYGFGLMDEAAVTLGALTWVGVQLLVGLVFSL